MQIASLCNAAYLEKKGKKKVPLAKFDFANLKLAGNAYCISKISDHTISNMF